MHTYHVNVCMYVRMYVHMYVYMYIHCYVCMYVCMCVCIMCKYVLCCLPWISCYPFL